MTHTYNIKGMTCSACVAKVKSELLKGGGILSADIQLQSPQATITMQKHMATSALQGLISKAGPYAISDADTVMDHNVSETTKEENSYYPIVLIFGYLASVTLLIQFVQNGFNQMQWMSHFMAGFFLVFSFFKLLNLSGFAESYSMYDIVAKKWAAWGYIYAFVELALGVAFLTGFNPVVTNAVTFIVMGISIIGVFQSVLNKRKIKCACLGAVFNIPMSTVTIIEDALMIAMSAIMIITML